MEPLGSSLLTSLNGKSERKRDWKPGGMGAEGKGKHGQQEHGSPEISLGC